MSIPRRNMELSASVTGHREEPRREGWRYWSRILWRVYRWSLLSMLLPVIMIVVARMNAGEPGSDAIEWICTGMFGFVLCSCVWFSVRLWRNIRAIRRHFEELGPPLPARQE